MKRLLVVPAAGLGTRLRSALPKALTPVLGRPMIDYLLDRYRPYCREVAVVANPATAGAMRAHLAGQPQPAHVVVQERATGMLDAVLAVRDVVATAQPDRIWITWCDQVAISAATK